MTDQYFKSYVISERKSQWLKCMTGKEIQQLAEKHNISESLIRHVIGMRKRVSKAFLPVLNDLQEIAALKDKYENEKNIIINSKK